MAHGITRSRLGFGVVLSLALPLACDFSGEESLGDNPPQGGAGSGSGGATPLGGAGIGGTGGFGGGVVQSGGSTGQRGGSGGWGGGPVGGSDSQATPCGGWIGDTCAADEYCAYEGGDCGYADGSAFCRTRPVSCPTVDEPVCGCDGVTHGNACEAAMMGTGYLRAGACEPSSCDFGGVTYPDGTSGIPAPDGCNTCSCDQGIIACTTMVCPVACGGELGPTCGEDEYCAYEGGDCGFADGTAVCRPRPTECDAILDPVCGCDGQDYSSACAAAMAGFGYLHGGACDAPTANCDQRDVICDAAPPVCPEREVPSVVDACYGSCIPVEQCSCTSAEECPQSDLYTCWVASAQCVPSVI